MHYLNEKKREEKTGSQIQNISKHKNTLTLHNDRGKPFSILIPPVKSLDNPNKYLSMCTHNISLMTEEHKKFLILIAVTQSQ